MFIRTIDGDVPLMNDVPQQSEGTRVHRPSTRLWQWWPLVLPCVAIGWVVAVELMGRPELHDKRTQEVLAIVLTSLALLGAVVHLVIARREFHAVLSALALAFLFREMHFDWTDKAVYGALIAIVVWALVRRKHIQPYTDLNPWVRIWLIGAGVTYVLSQAVARRAIQHVTGDDSSVAMFLEQSHGPFPVYGDIEEFLENTAHFMLLVTSLVGSWRPGGARPAH